MLVTPFGMVTLVMLEPLKAHCPILVTPFGMVTLALEPVYLVNTAPSILKSAALVVEISTAAADAADSTAVIALFLLHVVTANNTANAARSAAVLIVFFIVYSFLAHFF